MKVEFATGASRFRSWILVGGGYFTFVSLSASYSRFDGGVAFFWIANAFLIAWLSLAPRRAWRPVVLACFIANALASMLFGLGPLAALPVSLINMAEAVATVILLKRRLGDAPYFDSIRGVVNFVLFAGFVVPVCTAIPGCWVASLATNTALSSNYVNWLAGHALGAITFTPLFKLALRGDFKIWFENANPRLRINAALLLAILAAVTLMVFTGRHFPLLFLPLLPMMIITLQMGRVGAAAATAILAIVGAIMTTTGQGPVHLITGTDGLRAQFFQFYIATATVIALPVAALLKQYKLQTAQLLQSEARFHLIEQHTNHLVLDLDIDRTVRYVSPSLVNITGSDPSELVGRNALANVLPCDVAVVNETYCNAIAEPAKTFAVQHRVRLNDGRTLWFEQCIRAVIDANGVATGFVCVSTEISARKENDAQLLEAATKDVLTGTLNRRAFMLHLEQRVKQVASGDGTGTIALFDLDHFKRINDRYGHPVGDMVLRSFSRTMLSTLRQNDSFGRIGGEEFVMILWNTTPAHAALAVERLLWVIGETRCTLDDGSEVSVTASVGLAAIDPALDVDALLVAADRALYAAKASGRNCQRWAA